MSTDIAIKRKEVIQSFTTQLPEIAKALPQVGLDPKRFVRVALTTMQRNPQLWMCTRESLLGALMDAAALGLEIDALQGEAYLTQYKGKATLSIGYKGLLKLARRSNQVKDINYGVVCEGDEFEYEDGVELKLRHKQMGPTDKDKITHVWAVAKLINGGIQAKVLWRKDIERYRQRSFSKDKGPWVTDYDQMAIKTVLRQLTKLLPMNTDDLRTLVKSEAAEHGDVVEDVIDFNPETGEVIGEVVQSSALDAVVDGKAD